MTAYWLSCDKMTVLVETDRAGRIRFAAPIVGRFRGQHLANLIDWFDKIGGLQLEVLQSPPTGFGLQ